MDNLKYYEVYGKHLPIIGQVKRSMGRHYLLSTLLTHIRYCYKNAQRTCWVHRRSINHAKEVQHLELLPRSVTGMLSALQIAYK